MKHVFTVNSNLHLRNCIGIVKYLSLKYEDVIFINRRNLSIPSQFKALHLNKNLGWKFLPYKQPFKLTLTILWLSVYVKPLIKRELNKVLLNQNFHLYLPHIFAVDLRIFMRHEKCVGLSIVDEGTNGFFRQNATLPIHKIEKSKFFEYLTKLLSIKFETNRTEAMPSCDMVNHIFSTHRNSFTFYDEKKHHRLPMRLIFPEILKNKEKSSRQFINLLLIDPFVSEGRMDFTTYQSLIKLVISKIKKSITLSHIHVRFHPTILHNLEFVRNILIILSDQNVGYSIVDGDLEELLLSNEGNLFCTYSSVMIWANKFRWRVISWVNFLPKETYSAIDKTNPIASYLEICKADYLEEI